MDDFIKGNALVLLHSTKMSLNGARPSRKCSIKAGVIFKKMFLFMS